MEIWLDTSNVALVKQSVGLLDGVTTNPTILSKSKIPPAELIPLLLEAQPGSVAVQVVTSDIVKEALALASLSYRIVVKIPATQEGYLAIQILSQQGIPTLATALFEPRQALLAFKAGADYLAPYLGRIKDTGADPLAVLGEMESIRQHYGFPGKIMAAGIRDLPTALSCLQLGIGAMTLPDPIFTAFTKDAEPTLLAIDNFSKDWTDQGLTQSRQDSYYL